MINGRFWKKDGGGQGDIFIVSCADYPQQKFALKFLKQQKCPDRRIRMKRLTIKSQLENKIF